MVDYALPAEYPYKDEGEPGAQPLRAAEYNPLLAAVSDLAAAGGRVATLEANPVLNVDTTGAAAGQLLAIAQASPLTFELVDTAEITPADIGAQPAGNYATLVSGTIPDAQIPPGIARDSEVAAAVAALVASAPAALDTLNELASALGNDPAFATTITNALAGKAPEQTTIYLGAQDLSVMGGSTGPTLATAGGGGLFPAWSMDATANETVGASLRLPSTWTTFDLKVRSCNQTAGTGDVVLRESHGPKGLGDNLTTGFTAGTLVTLTAGAIGIMQEFTLATGIAVDATRDTMVQVSRRAADAADTLAADYGITAVILTKAS